MSVSAALESLRDREVVFELLRLETELLQDIQALKDRVTGDFGHALSVVTDRLDPGAIEAYYESPEGLACRRRPCDS